MVDRYSYDQFGTSLSQRSAPAALPEAQSSYSSYVSQPAASYGSSYQDSYQVRSDVVPMGAVVSFALLDGFDVGLSC